MKVESVEKTDYPELLAVWEASVRATHDFLREADIEELKPLILEQYFDAVELTCVREPRGKICGFCGVAGRKIEMLFVAPECRGRGVGTALCAHAMDQRAAWVDVNEQNPQALGFYEHLGFKVSGRSPVDGQGKPFPLLHLELIPS